MGGRKPHAKRQKGEGTEGRSSSSGGEDEKGHHRSILTPLRAYATVGAVKAHGRNKGTTHNLKEEGKQETRCSRQTKDKQKNHRTWRKTWVRCSAVDKKEAQKG